MTMHTAIPSNVVPLPADAFHVEGIVGFHANTIPGDVDESNDSVTAEDTQTAEPDPLAGADDPNAIAPPPSPVTVRSTALVNRADMLRAVNAATRAVEKRNMIPVLCNVLLKAEGGRLGVTGTDLDIEIKCPVSGAVDSEFAATVPAHTLAKLLKEAKASDMVAIDFEETVSWRERFRHESGSGPYVSQSDGRAVLDFDGLKVRLNTLPAADFPDLTQGELVHAFTLPTADFVRALGKTEFAISTEETRYYLNGVYMHVAPAANGVARYNGDRGTLRFTATDGHRMAVVEIEAPEGSENIPGVIIPRKTVAELLRLCKARGAPVAVSVRMHSGRVLIQVGDVSVLSKTIDGSFPDYARVVPLGNDKRLAINIDSLATGISQVTVISSERGKAVKLSMGLSALRLSVSNPDTGTAETCVTCDWNSDPMDIGFNSEYVRDILAQVESDDADLMLADPGSPAIIRGATDTDKGVYFVLMPMRV